MKERYRQALNLRQGKKTFKEIGDAIGVSSSRAREIVLKAQRLVDIEPVSPLSLDALSTRTANALRAENLDDREKVLAWITAEKPTPKKIPNIGGMSINEIRQWLGLGPDETPCHKPRYIVSASDLAISKAIKLLERNGFTVMRDSQVKTTPAGV